MLWAVPELGMQVPARRWVAETGWVRQYRIAAVGADLVTAALGSAVALIVRPGTPHLAHLLIALALPLVWVAAVAVARGYDDRFFGTGPEEFQSLLRSGVTLTAVVAFIAFAFNFHQARSFVVVGFPIALLAGCILRYVMRQILSRKRIAGECLRRVLVVGRGEAVTELTDRLERVPADGFQVIGQVVSSETYPGSEVSAELDPADVVAEVRRTEAEVVAVAADPELSGHRLRRLSWALEQQNVEMVVSPGLVEVAGPRIAVRPVAGLSLLHLENPSVSSGPYLIKRIFDRVAAAVAILLLSPVILGVAAAVRLTSRGPVFFRQSRTGIGGEEFTALKFRSMVVDAEDRLAALQQQHDGNAMLFKLHDDPRVTRVGRLLRRFSLDELPQLFNVLRGEMSLVGPRPPLPAEAQRYQSDEARRMLVPPGITGLWQVSGRSDLSWEESVVLDLRYVDNWSLTLDLLILWKTLRAVVGGAGAY